MQNDAFINLCQYLYGEHWQGSLQRATGVSKRTIRRWRSGESEPPPVLVDDLIKLAAEKSEAGKIYGGK